MIIKIVTLLMIGLLPYIFTYFLGCPSGVGGSTTMRTAPGLFKIKIMRSCDICPTLWPFIYEQEIQKNS